MKSALCSEGTNCSTPSTVMHGMLQSSNVYHPILSKERTAARADCNHPNPPLFKRKEDMENRPGKYVLS